MNITHTMPLIIDTLQFSKRMQKAGLQQKVADEFAEIFREAQTQSLENLATKQDLKNLETINKQDLNNLEQRLDVRIDKLESKFDSLESKFGSLESKFDSLEYKLTLKLFLMLTAAVGAITWLDKVVN